MIVANRHQGRVTTRVNVALQGISQLLEALESGESNANARFRISARRVYVLPRNLSGILRETDILYDGDRLATPHPVQRAHEADSPRDSSHCARLRRMFVNRGCDLMRLAGHLVKIEKTKMNLNLSAPCARTQDCHKVRIRREC